MATFVQVSGGRTSGYMAHLLKSEPDTFFMFQNTGREKPFYIPSLNNPKETRRFLIFPTSGTSLSQTAETI